MKRILPLALIVILAAANTYAQPNIFNPDDPIVNYNPANPPAIPPANTLAKWVKTTTRITWWDTGKFKSYFWNGMAFRLRFPNGYNPADATKKYPVILFLHGAGEIQGIYDNEDQLYWGAQPFETKINAGQFNAFMLFPQVSNTAWDYSYYTRINDVLDSLQKYCHTDPDKLIAMGLSNGAFGAMKYTASFPQRVSTVIASSPALIGLVQETQPSVIHIPHWVASGGLDNSPGPEVMNTYVDSFRAKGGDIKYNFYPELGHGTWEAQWDEPELVPTWTSAHKANPLIFYKKSQFCENAVTARLGISPGFAEYQWQVNNVDIPGSNTNEITGTQLGTYRVRFRRTAGGSWSDWSLKPAVITALATETTPPIKVTGMKSVVLPAPDGSTTVPLELPAGFATYEWRRVSDNVLVSNQRSFIAPVGQFKGKAANCNATYSPVFNVVNANGSPKPDSARNLTLSRVTSKSIKLNWTDVTSPASNETGFEIYRASTAGGPYTLASITAADTRTYTDTSLPDNFNFYYRVRAVNATGAAGLSNEAGLQPGADNVVPTVPAGVKAIFTSRNYIDLEWTASSDNVGVTAYDVYVNNIKKYTTTTPKVTADSLSPNSSYTFSIVARDQAGNVSANSSAITATSSLKGLKYHYYQGNWDVLPDFTTLTPVASGLVANVNIADRPAGVNDNFAFVWEGLINIRTPGTYTFETISDDGSKLYFNTLYSPAATPLVNNDGVHGAIPATGTITIPDTGLHQIAITFFEKNSGESMQVYWTGPGITRQLIPNSAFTDNFIAPADNIAPSVPANVKSTLVNSTSITLTWDNSTDNVGVTGYDIYLNNVKKYTTTTASVTADSLTAGTSYVFTIKARDFAGNTSAFSNAVTVSTTAATAGLTFKYYEGNWDVLPNFNSLTPVKTGSTPNIDIVSSRNVDDYFGYVWEGNIRIPTAGTYTFETISDDGSKIYFNSLYAPNATALVNNDGLHGGVSAKGNVTIAAGNYPIAITFFEKNSGETMQVYWSGPGIPRQLIPNAAFNGSYQPPADNVAPSIPASLNTAFVGNTSIDLTWTASTDNIGVVAYDIYVDNVKKYTATTNSVTADGLLANTTYSFTIKARDLSGNTSAASNALSVKTGTTAGGLKYKYYQGAWSVLPDFNALTPVKTGTSPNVDLTVRTAGINDNFGFLWEGFINIPAAGNYTFETISDDGSKVYFNSSYASTATALVSNDGLHGAGSATGTINVPSPGYYPISITYFERDGGESMQVYWSSSTITRQLIPNSAFVSQLPSDNIAPSVPANVKLVSANSTYINLSWDNSTDNVGVTGYDVYVNNIKKYTTATASVRADSLTLGTSYVFTVKARDFAGNTSAFSTAVTASTTSTTSGLTYKYYEGNWDVLPNFNNLTPVKTGSTPNIDIVTTRNVNDYFGYVWEGNINIPSAGTYTFETISDDGSKVYFNSLYVPNAIALVNNDGLHGGISATGTVTIAAGNYPIAITFFEKNSGETMQLYWSGPGIPRQLIPNAAFNGTFQVPGDNTAPSVPVNLKALLTTNTSIDLSWDNSTDFVGVTGYDVYMDNVKKTTVTTSYATITGLAANTPHTFTIKAFDQAGNMSAFSTALSATSAPKANGLKYRYYEGNWDVLPNFNTLTPIKTGLSATTDLAVRNAGVNDHFGFVWEGYINITTPGMYTFETISDDGSRFYFNTFYSPAATALVNNDGLHGPTSVTGSVNIPAAGLYPIAITFFEKESGETMQVYYSGPGIARQLIPNGSFGLAESAPDHARIISTDASSSLTGLNATDADASNINANITKAYPNPFRESLKVQYSSTTSDNNVMVRIYDMAGRLIQQQSFGNTPAGLNTFTINLNKLMLPGIYLVKLDVNGKPLKWWKMVKQRN